MSNKCHQVQLSIPMLPEMELAASRTAQAVAQVMQLDEERVDETAMALIEACLFAFHESEHGGRAHISLRTTEDQLEIYLHTLGEDVDPADRLGDAEELSLLPPEKKSWGLRIMEALMDRVEIAFLPAGPVIRMVKFRPSGTPV